MKELNKLAENSAELQDTIVYRGFVDESLDPDVTYDYGEETLVMITPLGEFKGSAPDGTPTKEIVDEDSIKMMATQTEEILLDKDHSSMRPISERCTEAMGWISGLKAITNLGDMSGLYGVIKWAGEGLKLAKDRIYRFLSPVFELDENGRAIKLVNVALTNRPALKMPPIINGEADDKENQTSITSEKKDTDNMNKEEINALVIEMVKKAIAENSKPAEETKEVINSEAEKVEEKKEDKPEEKAEEKKEENLNSCEEKKETAKNEASESPEKPEEKKEEKAEEVKNEEPKEEEKKEVIKADVLNSAPVGLGTDITSKDAWRSLKGQEFFDYLKSHKIGE